ncbi:hypothetical protein SAMN05216503_2501 [Polaribacter sp. KT25b]|nr:hypothetical protein SAMN05216503_2501 [Polaribacter sp. KT25b]
MDKKYQNTVLYLIINLLIALPILSFTDLNYNYISVVSIINLMLSIFF